MGFAASVVGRCKHQQQIAVQLQFGLDGMLLGFWFLTCTFSSSISSGSGQTEFLFHTCSKPCSLYATLKGTTHK